MNNYVTHFAAQSSSGNDAIGWFFAGSIGLWVFGALFCLLIFIIWVWSMIAMINLNSNFRIFFDDYWQRTHRDGIEDRNRVQELQDYKTEEQKKAEMAERLAKMKPRKAYFWAALSIPILLVVLVIVTML
jgi:hypothetical protein